MNAVSAIVHQATDSTYTIETDVCIIDTGAYAEGLYDFFTVKYNHAALPDACISYYFNHIVKKYL
jgi:hypothetical protein